MGFLGICRRHGCCSYSYTVVGGAPITAWICTKCLFTGITAGAAAFGLKGVEKAENEYHAGKTAANEIAERIAKKTEANLKAWSKTCKAGGISLLSAGVSSLTYLTIGKDCHVSDQNSYCVPSQGLFYLSSGICAAALIMTAGLGARYLRS